MELKVISILIILYSYTIKKVRSIDIRVYKVPNVTGQRPPWGPRGFKIRICPLCTLRVLKGD